MTRQDIAHLAFKITGLYCLIEAIPYLGWAFDARYWTPAAQPGNYRMGLAAMLLAPCLLVALGAYLLTKSRKMSERMFPGIASGSPEKILAVHALAFSIVAVFVIANALPRLVSMTVGLAWNFKQVAATPFPMGELFRYVLDPLIKLVLGLILFFGSHRLVRFWSRLRYAGIREKMGLCKNCGYDLSGNTSGICPECGTARANTSSHSHD